MFFLIHYDRRASSLVTIQSFEDRAEASRAKLDLEIALLESEGLNEVVLLEAKSQSALHTTHRRYFESLSELGSDREKYEDGSDSIKSWVVSAVPGGWVVTEEGVENSGVAPKVHDTKEKAVAAATAAASRWKAAYLKTTRVKVQRADGTSYDDIAT